MHGRRLQAWASPAAWRASEVRLLEAGGRCFGFGFGFGSALPERSPRISASLSSSWSRAVSGAAAILERARGTAAMPENRRAKVTFASALKF